jgi:hypothetical protein
MKESDLFVHCIYVFFGHAPMKVRLSASVGREGRAKARCTNC